MLLSKDFEILDFWFTLSLVPSREGQRARVLVSVECWWTAWLGWQKQGRLIGPHSQPHIPKQPWMSHLTESLSSPGLICKKNEAVGTR